MLGNIKTLKVVICSVTVMMRGSSELYTVGV